MHVTFLGHAALLVRAEGRALLLDPWFDEPVFAKAWWRYPPPPYPDAASLPAPDALLLSHIHPDHSGPGTLAQLSTATPTFALPFPSGALGRRLARARYERVVWAKAWEKLEVAPGVFATFVPHDRGWEVSSIVLEAGGTRAYHGNDNTLSLEAYREVAARCGPIDVAFLPFAGASSYPTGFAWKDRETLLARGAQKKAEGIARFTDGIRGLRPKVAVPFASSWALLEPSERWKNYTDRPTAAEALAAGAAVAKELGCEALLLEPGDEWTQTGGRVAKGLTAAWPPTAEAIARYAEAQRDRIEAARAARSRAEAPAPSAAALDRAFRTYFGDMLSRTAASTAELRMVAGFEATGAPPGSWHLRFEPGRAPSLGAGVPADADETLSLPSAELWDLLAGPANWEDPWYGYRLSVRKREGAGYYRAFWEMLLNYDDEAISERVAREAAT